MMRTVFDGGLSMLKLRWRRGSQHSDGREPSAFAIKIRLAPGASPGLRYAATAQRGGSGDVTNAGIDLCALAWSPSIQRITLTNFQKGTIE